MTYVLEIKVWDTRELVFRPVKPSGPDAKPYEWATEDEAYKAARRLYHLSVQGVDYRIVRK